MSGAAQKKEIPKIIGTRTDEFASLLAKWVKRHGSVPNSVLVRRAVIRELAREFGLGKRDQHLKEYLT